MSPLPNCVLCNQQAKEYRRESCSSIYFLECNICGQYKSESFHDEKIDGIFTSPPYVGVIDYHEQHRYAYELFNFPRLDDLEIGPARKGQNCNAKNEYVRGIGEIFRNVSRYLKDGALIFIVANDKFNLYPNIGKQCGFKLIDVFHRPVLMRTERDSNKYFESIFYFEKKKV